ncbi:hypothetical protein [Streptomyces sp. NPDC048361]|uniref:hypothetical protein n=1 Tax=Streptomyces sp. NPDC048361 TaxID=3154720 RepID=UPI0034192996
MSLVNVLVALAVVVLILVRQFKPQQVGGARRWWLVPAALAFFAVKDGGLVDQHHQAASVTLLGAEILIGVLMGSADSSYVLPLGQ